MTTTCFDKQLVLLQSRKLWEEGHFSLVKLIIRASFDHSQLQRAWLNCPKGIAQAFLLNYFLHKLNQMRDLKQTSKRMKLKENASTLLSNVSLLYSSGAMY